jgi:hypothetical protein
VTQIVRFQDKAHKELESAFKQSGIAHTGGDMSWLDDERIRAILLFKIGVNGYGKLKKHGNVLALVHELRVAHKNFNFSGIKSVFGVDPLIAAFCAAAHDLEEDMKTQADNNKQDFDPTLIQN